MGFFSWHTNDTNEPIWNCHTGKHDTVYMIDNLGNQWVEHFYDGYGEFGGKDYYELLAEMNGLPSDRGEGIDLAFSNPRKKHITPNLVTKPNQNWQPIEPKNHVGQGYWED